MEFAPEFTSGEPEKQKKLNSNPVFSQTPKSEKNELLNLRLDPELGAQFGDQSVQLARGLEQNIDSDKVQKFLHIVKSDLPNELKSYFDNLTAKDIANIIALVITATALIATGVGVVPATALIGARLGIQTVFIRAIATGLTRPDIISAIMGVIPGMKNFAPNQSIALAVNTLKDIMLYVLPGLATQAIAKSKDNTKK